MNTTSIYANQVAPAKAITRALITLALLVLVSGTSRADVHWDWAWGGEAGYFITDGSASGGVAPIGTYHVLDFAVTASNHGYIGSMSGGFFDEGFQPGTGFVWNGSNDTLWFRDGGVWTNGANYFVVGDPLQTKYLFFPGFYRIQSSASGNVDGSSTITMVPNDLSLGTPFCFGDGGGAICPCGNSGSAGEGCANSTGAGASLSAAGSASVGADDLSFQMTNGPAGVPAILFTGTQQANGGNGTLFGDGLLCAGGAIQRLNVVFLDGAGAGTWGPGLAPQGGWMPSDTRHFQGWYRDVNGSPCGGGFNTSHGMTIAFQP